MKQPSEDIRFEDRLLAELKQTVAQRAATAPRGTRVGSPRAAGLLATYFKHGILPGAAAVGSMASSWARTAGRRVWRWTAVAGAAVVLAALVLPGTLGPQTALDGGRSEAVRTPAQVLELAAQRIAFTPEVTPRADKFIFSESVVVYQTVRVAGWHVALEQVGERVMVRQWRPVDGIRDGLTKERPLSTPGATWHVEPIPGCRGGMQAGAVRQPVTAWACGPGGPGEGLVGGLPFDGDAMYAYLYRPTLDDFPAEYPSTISADERALGRAADTLYLGQYSPAVQAAVFAAVGRIPGVTVRAGATDVLGRSGVALVYADQNGQTELIFDAGTYRYLGVNRTTAPVSASPGPQGRQLVLRVVAGQAVQRVAIVDEAGALP